MVLMLLTVILESDRRLGGIEEGILHKWLGIIMWGCLVGLYSLDALDV
jgi:hypothetical protein